MPSVFGQRAAQASGAGWVQGAVFCGSAVGGEELCDCARAGATYVALTFALGSEPPPAIVRCVGAGGEVRLGWWVVVEKARRAHAGRRFRARRPCV